MTPQPEALCYVAVMAAFACAASSVSYVRAQTCEGCHAAQFTSQSGSAHAGALSRVSDHPEPAGVMLLRVPQYRYEILRADSLHIDDGADLMDLPLEWVFGAGHQASTFVTRVNQDWYLEHYAMWYAATNSYGPTPGQEAVHPKSISEAAGVLYGITDPKVGMKGCFECYSTGPVSFGTMATPRSTKMGSL